MENKQGANSAMNSFEANSEGNPCNISYGHYDIASQITKDDDEILNRTSQSASTNVTNVKNPIV